MTHLFSRHPARIIRGPSSDRMSATNVLPDTMFIETDTHLFYFWDEDEGPSGGWMTHQASAEHSGIVSSFSIYQSGSMVKAKNNTTGMVQYEGDNTVDCVPTIQAAINNIPDADSTGWGGTVNILRGNYKCVTRLDLDIGATGYHGVELIGEGKATRLNFTPSTSMSIAILLKMSRLRLANMRIYGNSNVAHLAYATGSGSIRHDWGILERVDFDGANFTGAGGPEEDNNFQVGQTGLLLDGTAIALFFWTIYACHFRGLATGINLYEFYATSTDQFGNVFVNCDVAEKVSGGQHNFDDLWIQGTSSNGMIGLHFLPDGTAGTGSVQNVNNIHAEMHKATTECAAVMIDPGVGNIRLSNIYNAYADGNFWHHILDKTGSIRGNIDLENGYVKKLSSTRQRYGSFAPGFQTKANAEGILRGNVEEFLTGGATVPTNTFVKRPEGTARQFSTLTTNNNIVGFYYLPQAGSRFDRSSNPVFRMRFMLETPLGAASWFIGLWSNFTAPSAGTDQLNTKHGIGLYGDKSTYGDWRIQHNDGTGASGTPDALSTPINLTANVMYDLEIRTVDHATTPKFHVTLNGVRTTITSEIPLANIDLGWLVYLQLVLNNFGGQIMYIYDMELETSK